MEVRGGLNEIMCVNSGSFLGFIRKKTQTSDKTHWQSEPTTMKKDDCISLGFINTKLKKATKTHEPLLHEATE